MNSGETILELKPWHIDHDMNPSHKNTLRELREAKFLELCRWVERVVHAAEDLKEKERELGIE